MQADQAAENARQGSVQLMMEITHRIRQSLDLDAILQTTVEEVRQFLQTDRVLIFRFEPDFSGIVMVESVAPAWNSILTLPVRDECLATNYLEPFQNGQVTAKSDIYTSKIDPCHRDLLATFQVRANLVVPILQGPHLWGLLIAHHCAAPRQWQSLEIDLLKQLALQLGIAIQQSGLVEHIRSELDDRIQAEARYRLLFESTPNPIWVIDQDSLAFLEVNQAAIDHYGYSKAEFLAMTIADILDSGSLTRHRQKDGQLIDVETTEHALTFMGKSARLVMVKDVTEKNQLAAQLLHTQRLESLGTLASGIAHDLNNILTPILSIAQLLPLTLPQDTQLDAKNQRLLQILEDSAKRGSDLVQQILSFARGTAGEYITMPVGPLLSEVERVIEQTFPKSITLSKSLIPPMLWLVSADATQLHQVLMNLAINARDAMPNGGALSIEAKNMRIDANYARMHLDAQVGDYVVIQIADTGKGIPPEVYDRMFEPFFTTKEVGKGTGLGLSTVLTIVKQHGGFVTADSEPNTGTRFTIYIPALADANRMECVQSIDTFVGNGALILVADDEAAIREITKLSLEAHHYRVITASDGIEAFVLYAEQHHEIQAVLLDLMMPALDPTTTIRTLRRINPQVPIIAMSGLALNATVAAEDAATIQGFLAKPFTAYELLATLDQVIPQAATPA
jgi:two-component system, cell cycle sensor histidine kinase and response regulator CckA